MFNEEIIDAIKAGRIGLNRLVNNQQVIELIDRYPLDEESRKRIGIHFKDYRPYFCDKDGGEPTMFPAEFFGRYIRNQGIYDYLRKWFLFLYCITSAADDYDKLIDTYLDGNISSNCAFEMDYQSDMMDLRQIRFEEEREEVRKNLVEGIIDIDMILNRFYDQIHRLSYNQWDYDCLRQGLSEFCLSAGYHFVNDSKYVPSWLNDRVSNEPFLFYIATSMYVSIITGNDFYDELEDALNTNGEDTIGDVFAMIKKNKALGELRSKKHSIEAQLAENAEDIRKQETAGEIIVESFGKNLPYEVIESRIKKSIDSEHWGILCWLESITGKRFSFLDVLNLSSDSNYYYDEILKKYGTILSDKEIGNIKTVENLADTVIRHKNSRYGDLQEDDEYDLETRIRETELEYNIDIDRSRVRSVEELCDYVNDFYSSIREKIKQMIVDYLGVEESEVTVSANFTNDLGADSLDRVELPMKAEHEFGIKISEEESIHIKTVYDLYEIVIAKLKEIGISKGLRVS